MKKKKKEIELSNAYVSHPVIPECRQMTTRLNTDLDDEMFALYEACAADSEYDSKSDYVRALIREDAERRGLTPDDAPTDDEGEEEPGIAETYDPDELRTSPLTVEELEELAREGVPEINPVHVPDDVDDFVQKTGLKAAVVAAAARHGHEKVTRDDLVDLTEDIWGRGGNGYYVNKDDANLPGRALGRLWRDFDSLGDGDDDEYYALTATEYLPKWIASTNVFEGNVEEYGWNRYRDKEVDLLRRQGQEIAKAGADVEEIRPRMDDIDKMAENQSADTTDLPDGVDPMFGDDESKMVDTAEEWSEKTQEVVENEELPVDGALVPRKEAGEKALEEHADHPRVHLIREGVDALEEEIERRRQSDEADTGDEAET